MVKHGEGLGYEIVKAVLSGEIIEPITFQKVKAYCERSGIHASENHMSVILSNATENNHSPTYKVYFERVGKGKYRILPEYRRETKYFWLNVDSVSYEWSFSDLKVGRSQTYSNLNSNGNRRKNELCFKYIQIGDKALAYETGTTKAITTICQVVDKYEENGEILIEFRKISDYDLFLELDSMKTINELVDCDILNNHRGTLLELEKKHFDVLTRKLEDLNGFDSYYNELNMQVKQSLADGNKDRIARLDQRTSVIPEVYEIRARMFKRNPDVIAEVLVRANGKCEKCGNPAPFNRASDGTPYLEVHHKKRLADGGEDTVDNAIAVCPNCHRELHFG
ncbi:HNH endonuclease [Paenibacillus sp. 32352]|uniref:HNH endonuclease n=1 Tax=Paenibacillus sp. 32352 TaxID=1969111 RepID=UPI0009AD7D47|nr:HNH endonuclease [Paenibacillus sp. 32352]